MTTETVSEPTPWVPTVEDFGARLALVRHRMGWNVKEAARECGMPAASWRFWEVDGGQPRNIITIAMTIATRTGCDYLWLVHGPDRGGARPTTRYAPGGRLLARVGEDPINRPHSAIHRGTATRPVRQTRPLSRGSRRPVTPVAV